MCQEFSVKPRVSCVSNAQRVIQELLRVEHMLWCLQIQVDCLKTLLLLVCVWFVYFEFVNSIIVMIQGCLIQVLLKNICFLKKVENQPVELSFQPVVLHLVFLKRIWKGLKLVDLAVKPIQLIVSCFQSVDFWKSLTKFY